MSDLSTKLFRAEQARAMDRLAIQQYGIPGYELMTRAGQAAFNLLLTCWPGVQTIAVFCGSGNNAGDGYVLARLALAAGYNAEVFCVSKPAKLHGDALTAYLDYRQQGGLINEFHPGSHLTVDVIVDALLGTGIDRPVSGRYAAAIETINNAPQAGVLALDIPSGLNADTGCIMGSAILAQQTISFIALKQGLFTADAPGCCGTLHFDALAVPDEVYEDISESSLKINKPVFKLRQRCAHKGTHGHVLVIGGAPGYSGAARLAAEAAARTGAGLVTVATHPQHAALMNACRPEIMCHGVQKAEQLAALITKATVLVIGPGLGQGDWGGRLYAAAISADKPMIVDADGLNLLAKKPIGRANWVLTPHPGETARLLNISTAQVQQDRFAALRLLQEKYTGICVLKGPGTLVSDGVSVAVSTTGNPGMASGGMGDVLAGVIAAFVAQGMALMEAACSGVYVQGEAADLAAESGERGLLASDLMMPLRRLVNNL